MDLSCYADAANFILLRLNTSDAKVPLHQKLCEGFRKFRKTAQTFDKMVGGWVGVDVGVGVCGCVHSVWAHMWAPELKMQNKPPRQMRENDK